MFVDPKVQVIQKSVYSLFDFLRDVGGLAFLFSLLSSGANKLFTFNKLENLLVAHLYTKPSHWWGNKAEIKGSS